MKQVEPLPNPVLPVLITERTASPPDGLKVITPEGVPNVVIQTMTVVAQILVRGLRTYVQSLLGFLMILLVGATLVDNIGIQIMPMDFLEKLRTAALLALAPTVIALLQNFAELLARLDEKFPRLRA